jgi:hypothetical protein
MNDLEKLKELNKQNKEEHAKQTSKQNIGEIIHGVLGILIIASIGFVCYQWGYSNAENHQLKQEIVIDKQEQSPIIDSSIGEKNVR